jgi:capsular exopolysaccharide synthesis family protein
VNRRLPGATPATLAVGPYRPRAPVPEGTYPDRLPDADIRGIGTMLRRRRGTILAVFLAVFGAVAALTFLWPKTYQSSALVLVEQRTPRLESSALAVLERLGRGSQIETEMELMRSRRVIERVVDQLDLHVLVETPQGQRRPRDVFPAFDAGPDARAGSYRLAVADSGGRVLVTERTSDSLVATLAAPDFAFLGLRGRLPRTLPRAGILVEVLDFPRAVQATQNRLVARRAGRQADLVRLDCDGSTPASVHALCQRTLDSYMALRTELQRTEATVTARFLREQGERVGSELALAEDSLEGYGRANRVVALEDRATAEVTQHVQLKAQRDQLEAERVALAGMIEEIETEAGTRKYRNIASFPTFLKNDAVTEMLTSLIALENRRSDLVTRRSETNADVVALDGRIHDIERQLGTMAVNYEQALREQVATLDRTLASAAARLAIIPSQQMQNARLERKVALLDDLYRVLEGRLQEAEVAEAVELPSVRVVDAASEPFQPISPKLPLNLALGFVLAMTSGLGVALLAEARDTRVRERHEVERQTGLPVLTIVPHLRRPGSVMPLPALSRKDRTGAAPAQLTRTVRATNYRASADNKVALECFRSLAADLSFAARAAGNGGFQTVAVTSPGRGEGKTLTACNLALVRAADGVRTLLIDGDMRAGRVARFFEFPAGGPGLSDVLTAGTDVGGVWRGVVGQSELWVVPAGTPTESATSLLGSPAFARIIERARTRFQLVIVDTPPLNMISDAATVAASVDAVVVVVREGWTEREALEVTLARLERAGGNVVGVVLNDVSVPREYAVTYGYATAVSPG